MMKYVGGKEASKYLRIHHRTLYNIEKFMKEKEFKNDNDICLKNLDELDKKEGKLNISYVRVSTANQKDDLNRQKEMIKNQYPNHIMIEDIGSGINLNKKGIRKIIKLAIEGKVNELVIAYKDRLTRYGYELIEDLIKDYSNG